MLSVSVPGAVGAVELAAKAYGTKPLSDIMAPAATLAERGFPVSQSLAAALRSNREVLGKVPSSRRIWFDGDRPLEMGDGSCRRDLAATLREIGAKGSAAFYEGSHRAEVRRLHEGQRRPHRRRRISPATRRMKTRPFM